MSSAVIVALALVLVIQEVLLMNQLAIHRRLDGLPARAAVSFKLEAEARARADASAVHDAAKQMAAPLFAGLREAQEGLAADFRRQVANAEMRARVGERHAANTTTALETAAVLVRELRAGIDATGEARARLERTAAETDDNRTTIEVLTPPSGAPPPSSTAATVDEGWDDPEEHTTVFTAKDRPKVPALRSPPEPRSGMLPPPLTPAERG